MMEQRQAVVREARRWLGTPYHHNAAVLGGGVDCARLILEAHIGADIGVERFSAGEYTHDWHMHRSEERYLQTVEAHLHRVDDTDAPLCERDPDFSCLPGDVLVWRVGRTYSHGAIVTDWPRVVHASHPARLVEEVSVVNTPMSEKLMRVYSYWGDRK